MLDKRDECHEERLKIERIVAGILCERSRKTVMSISFCDDDVGGSGGWLPGKKGFSLAKYDNARAELTVFLVVGIAGSGEIEGHTLRFLDFTFVRQFGGVINLAN